MTDWIEGVTFDLAPWQQALVVVAALLVILGAFLAVDWRDRRRQRQLDEAIRRRYSVLR